jgi:GGDEF domain-containing protein
MRQIANHARNDIRMVDDLAYVGPGAFCVLLPGTDGTGAAVVQERLTSGIRTLIGANPEEVGSAVLHAAADSQALKNLAEHLNPEQIKPPISAPGPDRRAVGADSRQEPVA